MVIRGDCIEVMQAMKDESFDLIFADPPYNLQLKGKGLKRSNNTFYNSIAETQWDKFESLEEYEHFTEQWLIEVRRLMKRKSSLWVTGTYHNIFVIGHYLLKLNFEILNQIAWIKSNPTPQFSGTRFCQSIENLIWAKKKKGIHYFNYQGMKKENKNRQMKSDWYIPSLKDSERIGRFNISQKPEELLYRVIIASSKKGDSVLDPFCGTGTTGKVCAQLGREFTGIELDPIQAGIAEQRIQSTVELLF